MLEVGDVLFCKKTVYGKTIYSIKEVIRFKKNRNYIIKREIETSSCSLVSEKTTFSKGFDFGFSHEEILKFFVKYKRNLLLEKNYLE